MTICYITTVHYRYDTRVYLKLAQFFANLGHEVILIVADGLGNENINNLKIIDIGKPKTRIHRFFKQFKVAKLIYSLKKYQNYHLHDPELLGLGIILKIFRLKIIYDIHELVHFDILEKEWIKNKKARGIVANLYNYIEKFCIRHFNYILLAEEGYKSYYYKWYPQYKEKFYTIRNFPISILNNSGHTKVKKYEPNKILNLIYVGSISANRGILEVIKSLSLINKPIIFTLIGRWESEDLFLNCQNEENWKYVNYIGHIKSAEIQNYLDNADIGICTLYPEKNYLDTMPVKSFEYMNAGMPMIMSNFPFWMEFYKDFSLFCDPKNHKQIADSINLLIENPFLFNEFRKRINQVKNKFTWESEAQRLLEIYEENTDHSSWNSSSTN